MYSIVQHVHNVLELEIQATVMTFKCIHKTMLLLVLLALTIYTNFLRFTIVPIRIKLTVNNN